MELSEGPAATDQGAGGEPPVPKAPRSFMVHRPRSYDRGSLFKARVYTILHGVLAKILTVAHMGT